MMEDGLIVDGGWEANITATSALMEGTAKPCCFRNNRYSNITCNEELEG